MLFIMESLVPSAWGDEGDCANGQKVVGRRPQVARRNFISSSFFWNSSPQESLPNAKVSPRQTWYIGRNSLNLPPLRIAQQYQRNLYIVEKYFQWATIPSQTMRVNLYS